MQRIQWVDNLKGLLLFLVILQHISPNDWGTSYFTVFHMATFFFISGMLYNDDKYMGIKPYLKHKWRTLLYPYFVFSFGLMLIDPIYYFTPCTLDSSQLISGLALKLNWSPYIEGLLTRWFIGCISIVNGHSFVDSGALWFVFVLFFCSIGIHSLLMYLKNRGAC